MSKVSTHPSLSLVGGGPGDPDLLTLKAVKALENAAVVLYDALVNVELLKHAPKARHIFVGKRKGCQAFAQEQINALLVKYAREYGHVVRLKGGDPFVFGRGKEEARYAEAQGIPTVVIPGISSAMAVPASLGIPVTHRNLAESFWVITGTTSHHRLSRDVFLAAKSSATVIILMGMARLGEITDIFKATGKKDLPVAVIQNGCTSEERAAIGTVDTIEKAVLEKGLSNPAIIIIGKVVAQASSSQGLEQVRMAGFF